MFGSDKKSLFNERKDSERSLISETVSIDGTVNSSGAIDIAGLIKGPVFSKEVVIKETGSISGTVEADRVEVHGHLDVKGDIEFTQNLRTEDGADIEGYIKKGLSLEKTSSTADFLFSKPKDKKENKKNGKPANGQKEISA